MERGVCSKLRLDHERINENALQYIVPNMFAGSIFDLEPGTDYECRLVLADPDGVDGKGREHRDRSHASRAQAGRREQDLSRVSARLQR